MLELGNIPLRTADRPQDLRQCPLVIAGGGALLSAEPLAPFIDLMVLGDGEESLPDVLRLLEQALDEGWTRDRCLEEARHIHGVYIPSFFTPDAEGRLQPRFADHARPSRRIVADFDKVGLPHQPGGAHRRGAQPPVAGDRPRLYARLPFLPCGHGLPPPCANGRWTPSPACWTTA